MSAPAALAVSAECFCFTKGTNKAVIIYLMASKAGLLGQTPTQLAASASCYCFNDGTYRSIASYLLSIISGQSTSTPAQLASASDCYCFTPQVSENVEAYLWDVIVGVGPTPSQLASSSKCYCYDETTQKSVIIYLLNIISAQNATPSQLAVSAKCYCFDDGAFRRVKSYLLDVTGTVPVAPVVPAPDIFWAKLNEGVGTTFADSAQGDNGTIRNATQWVTGASGSGFALSFNSVLSDWAQTGGNVNYNSASKITISFWWFTQGAHNVDGILLESSVISGGNNGSFLIYDSSSATLRLGVRGTTGNTLANAYTLPSNNAWHNIVFLLDSTVPGYAVTAYIDTVLAAPTMISASDSQTVFNNYPLFIGARNASSVFATARIDDIRIWSGDKTAFITQIFNNPQ